MYPGWIYSLILREAFFNKRFNRKCRSKKRVQILIEIAISVKCAAVLFSKLSYKLDLGVLIYKFGKEELIFWGYT